MRKNFTPGLIIILLLVLVSFKTVSAQQFYVIVGTFTHEDNAIKYTGYMNSNLYNAHYEANKDKTLFYVYTLKTTNHNIAMAEAKRLQDETEFKDAWVFAGLFGNQQEPIIVETPELKTPVIVEEPKLVAISEATTDSIKTKEQITLASTTMHEPKVVVRGKLVKFSIQSTDGKPITGEVHSVDFDHGRDLATYKTNQYIDLLAPARDSNPLTLVCGIFGYKEVIKLVDYNDLSQTLGVTKDDKGVWTIQYQLERMKKGDVTVMYHVAFYKDAVVMLPPAKAELDELISMMRDNPNYKIKIHGHCNGNNSRRIIALGKSKNYFDVKGSDEYPGSAKELSKLRAQAVQMYLIDNGIDKSRSEIFAWGALNMLVPENSNSAKLNDRIEIEITQD